MLMLLGGPFAFVSSRAVGAAMTAFLLMLMVMPPLIAWLKRKKFGESGAKNQGAGVVDEARERKKGTPTMAAWASSPSSPSRRCCGAIRPPTACGC